MTVIAVNREHLGVPAFWVDGASDEATGLLMFRVGSADETLRSHGITKMALRVLLETAGSPDNAWMGLASGYSWIVITGERREVGSTLARICEAANGPDLEAFDGIRDQMINEFADGGDAMDGFVSSLHYGAAGYGLGGYEDFGVFLLSRDDVAEWLQRFFAGQNAVFSLTCRPSGISVRLPIGKRSTPPMPSPVALPHPRWVAWPDLVGAWFTGRHLRDAPSYVARHTAAERLRNEVQRLTGKPNATEWCTHVDCRVELTQVVCQQRAPNLGLAPAETTAGVIEGLARSGPTNGELQAAYGSARVLFSDPTLLSDIASGAALDHLMGVGFAAPAEILRSIQTVSSADVQSSWASALTTGVWLFREGDQIPEEAGQPLAACGEPPTEGHSFELGDGSPASGRLVVGRSAVTEQRSPTDSVTIPFERCAALVTWTDGATSVYGAEGDLIHIDPDAVADAQLIMERLLAGIPTQFHVSASIPHFVSTLEAFDAENADGQLS